MCEHKDVMHTVLPCDLVQTITGLRGAQSYKNPYQGWQQLQRLICSTRLELHLLCLTVPLQKVGLSKYQAYQETRTHGG